MSQQAALKNDSLNLRQAIGLVVLGILVAYFKAGISMLWLGIVISAVYGFVIRDTKWLWYGVAASPGMELLSRMARSPFVPHEMGKYYLVLAIGLLFIQNTTRSSNHPAYKSGSLMLAFLLPSILVGVADFNFEDWVLNVLGILELAILLVFVARERWSVDRFCRVLQFALIPIVLVAIYLVIHTPDFKRLYFSLSSNFKTSGDFGSDQVSTILGLGMVLTILLIILKRPLFKISWLNYALLCLLLFRGFLTFSRGGMLAAILAIIISILPAIVANKRSFIKFSLIALAFIGVSVLVFIEVNELTGNQLLLRYQGETAGTMAGTKERNLNTLTSYRFEIAETDWNIFKDNIVFGVGPGSAKDLRPQYGFEAIASHTEYTRLLSEHGLGGVAVVILLFVFPVWWVREQKLNTWRAVSAALFALALLTCLHSAMRTNTTVVCYLLAAMPVYFFKGKTGSKVVA